MEAAGLVVAARAMAAAGWAMAAAAAAAAARAKEAATAAVAAIAAAGWAVAARAAAGWAVAARAAAGWAMAAAGWATCAGRDGDAVRQREGRGRSRRAPPPPSPRAVPPPLPSPPTPTPPRYLAITPTERATLRHAAPRTTRSIKHHLGQGHLRALRTKELRPLSQIVELNSLARSRRLRPLSVTWAGCPRHTSERGWGEDGGGAEGVG